MADYRSYGAQSGHYFDRAHEGAATRAIETPAAWRGGDPDSIGDWRFGLAPAHVAELDRALAHAAATGKDTGQLSAEDFPLPTLSPEIRRWRDAIADGRGFQVVSGFPVDRWSLAESERAFWCVGLHLGQPGAQNPQGDLLGHVRDDGSDTGDPFVRLYRTRSEIAYHCDAADIVGLLCLRKAQKGGISRIVSSVSVYNQLLVERPDLAPRLYEPFLVDVRNEDASGTLRYVPVPACRHTGGRLRTFYHSDYFRSVQRFDDVAPFTESERELLDCYEEIASRPEFYLDMDLAPGEVQWLSNHTVLHGRTAYQDPADPAARRHLLRLWLSVDA